MNLWSFGPHATPVQLQKGEESSQEAKDMRGSAVMRDLNVISACLSALFAGVSAADEQSGDLIMSGRIKENLIVRTSIFSN